MDYSSGLNFKDFKPMETEVTVMHADDNTEDHLEFRAGLEVAAYTPFGVGGEGTTMHGHTSTTMTQKVTVTDNSDKSGAGWQHTTGLLCLHSY